MPSKAKTSTKKKLPSLTTMKPACDNAESAEAPSTALPEDLSGNPTVPASIGSIKRIKPFQRDVVQLMLTVADGSVLLTPDHELIGFMRNVPNMTKPPPGTLMIGGTDKNVPPQPSPDALRIADQATYAQNLAMAVKFRVWSAKLANSASQQIMHFNASPVNVTGNAFALGATPPGVANRLICYESTPEIKGVTVGDYIYIFKAQMEVKTWGKGDQERIQYEVIFGPNCKHEAHRCYWIQKPQVHVVNGYDVQLIE